MKTSARSIVGGDGLDRAADGEAGVIVSTSAPAPAFALTAAVSVLLASGDSLAINVQLARADERDVDGLQAVAARPLGEAGGAVAGPVLDVAAALPCDGQGRAAPRRRARP